MNQERNQVGPAEKKQGTYERGAFRRFVHKLANIFLSTRGRIKEISHRAGKVYLNFINELG